jgi:excisionase family DNA binding protein
LPSSRGALPQISGREWRIDIQLDGLLLKPEQAAKALGIGRTKLYKILHNGQLQSIRIGGSRRISIQALEAYISGLESSLKT